MRSLSTANVKNEPVNLTHQSRKARWITNEEELIMNVRERSEQSTGRILALKHRLNMDPILGGQWTLENRQDAFETVLGDSIAKAVLTKAQAVKSGNSRSDPMDWYSTSVNCGHPVATREAILAA